MGKLLIQKPDATTYAADLTMAMSWLAEQPDTLFIGQAVRYPGTLMHGTLESVPEDKRIELPVFEETQMGMSLGLALSGYCVVSVYPRVNFLLAAMNQLVNHLDKAEAMGAGRPRVIVRTAVASEKPLDPGPQHKGNYIGEFEDMLSSVDVIRAHIISSLDPIRKIPSMAYQDAYESRRPCIVVEYMELYGESLL